MSCEVLIAVALQWCWNLFELGPSTRLPDAWFSNSQNGLVRKSVIWFLDVQSLKCDSSGLILIPYEFPTIFSHC